jgi:hypothetical protein
MQIYGLGGGKPRGDNILLSMRDTLMRPSHMGHWTCGKEKPGPFWAGQCSELEKFVVDCQELTRAQTGRNSGLVRYGLPQAPR